MAVAESDQLLEIGGVEYDRSAPLAARQQLRPDPARGIDIKPARRLFQDEQLGVVWQQADEHALVDCRRIAARYNRRRAP